MRYYRDNGKENGNYYLGFRVIGGSGAGGRGGLGSGLLKVSSPD